MTNKQRLQRIAEIIWDVDLRCMAADGPVTPTLDEMRQEEISEVYELASQQADSVDTKDACACGCCAMPDGDCPEYNNGECKLLCS